MKNKASFVLLLIVFAASVVSCSIRLVKSTRDISQVDSNASKYVGKPLNILLDDIKPKIKLFFAEQRSDSSGTILFYFVDHKKFVELSKSNTKLARMMVYVSGKIAENNYSLPLETRFNWTSEYRQKSKSLIVNGVRVREGDSPSASLY